MAAQNQLQKGEEEYKRCEQQLRETRVSGLPRAGLIGGVRLVIRAKRSQLKIIVNQVCGLHAVMLLMYLVLPSLVYEIMTPPLQAQYERMVRDNDILNQRLTKAQQDYENQLMNR